MNEHSIAVPLSLLLPLAGSIVAALGWLFNLQGRLKEVEAMFATYRATTLEDKTQYRATTATDIAQLHHAKHDMNNRLHLVVGRLDLCEERHRTFVAETRRELQRLNSDQQLGMQLARLQRSLQAGRVVDLQDAVLDGE